MDSQQQAFVHQTHAELIEQKIQVDILHKVALLLWPKFNQLRMMPAVETAATAALTDSSMSTGLTLPAAKPRRDTDFAEWENQDDDGPDEDVEDDEDEQRHIMDYDRDLLGWWKINILMHPKLAKLARSVLCVPASSSSERVFNAAGRMIEQRRTTLKPATVDAILFLHDNM